MLYEIKKLIIQAKQQILENKEKRLIQEMKITDNKINNINKRLCTLKPKSEEVKIITIEVQKKTQRKFWITEGLK